MIVPSRSTKTARDFELAEVMFETGDQFVARDSRGPKFSNDNRARMVCDLGGFERCRVAGEREREHRDRRVARAGNIEHVARFGGDVVRMLSFFEKHDAVLTERDEQVLNAPFLEQLLPRANK